MSIQAGYINILESSVVTVSSELAAQPSYRLYDRMIGPYYQATSAANQSVLIDQGSANCPTITGLVIPAGHNLAGCAISFQWSDDNSVYYDHIVPWTQPDGGLIFKYSIPQFRRFWLLSISGCAAPIQLSELFLSNVYTFSAQPVYDGAEFGKKRNVTRIETLGGKANYQIKGPGRRVLTYQIPNIASSELSTFTDWDDAFQMAKPFFFIDHQGNKFFAEFVNEPRFKPGPGDYTSLAFSVQEII